MAAPKAIGKDTREGEIHGVFFFNLILDEITIIYNILGSLATLTYSIPYLFLQSFIKDYLLEGCS